MFLSIVLLVSSIPLSAVATELNDSQAAIDSTISSEPVIQDTVIIDPIREPTVSESVSLETLKQLGPGEKTLAELQTMQVDVASLPEFINAEHAVQKGHVNRLEEQETALNTVIYQNTNGTKSTYIFAHPVKYRDSDGVIHDKSRKLSAVLDTQYAYAMVNNSTKVYFPKTVETGTLLQHGEYAVSMKPVTDTASALTYLNDESVAYHEVFGRNTSVVYSTQMNGLKEDIVLFKNIGKTEFAFELTLTNLTPVLENNTWNLKNQENKTVGSLGKILITDQAGNSTVGSITLTETAVQGKYSLTIQVPEAFLIDETTVYPVYVDPTIHIFEQSNHLEADEYGDLSITPYTSITDTLLTNSNDICAITEEMSYSLVVGSPTSDFYSGARIVYKLPDFFGEYGQYKTLKASEIASAYLYINVDSGEPTSFQTNPMTATWSDTTDASIAVYDTTLYSSYASNYSVTTSIPDTASSVALNITDIVKGWARYNSGDSTNAYDNPENGFAISNTTSDYDCARYVTSTEAGISTDDVYVVLNTSYLGGSYYVNNIITGRFLKDGNTSMTTSQYEETDAIQWHFEYLGNDQYYIKSVLNSTYALYGSDSSVSLAAFPTNPSNAYVWDVRLSNVGGMIIKNVASGKVLRYDGTSLSLVAAMTSDNDNYRQTTWNLMEVESYVNLTDFDLSDDWLLPDTYKYFNVEADASWTAEENFTWSILSDNGSGSNNVFTVSDDGRVYASQYGGTATLTVSHKMTGLIKTFKIKSGEIREGTYMILNKATGRYMEIEGPSTNAGALIQQGDYHTGTYAKWTVEIFPSGFYTIQSVYSSKWLKVGTSTDTNAVFQDSSYGTPTAKWYITKTASGNYKISPTNANTYAISVPLNENEDGSNLTQLLYTNDSNHRDEWIFDDIGETDGVVNGNVYYIQATHSDKVLEASGAATADGTNIIQQELDESKACQSWRLTYVGNGDYLIQDTNSGKYLSVDGDAGGATNIHLWQYDNADSEQLFKIRKNTDGTYSFLSKCSSYGSVIEIESSSMVDGGNVRQYYHTGATNQKFNLIESIADCPSVVVPCAIAISPSYTEVNSFDVYLDKYLDDYEYLLNNTRWEVSLNGVMTFNQNAMTVKGVDVGLGWIEAYDSNNRLIFICYVYVDNIIKDFSGSVQEYLYGNNSFLGTFSCLRYESNPDIDPLIFRTEWYLYAVKLKTQGLSRAEIRTGLEERFDLDLSNDEAFTLLIAEVEYGALGGYTRESLTLSFDGLRFLLDFYLGLYVAYNAASNAAVNPYISKTEQEILTEKAHAENWCKNSRKDIKEIKKSMRDMDFSDKTMVSTNSRNEVWAGRSYDQAPYKPNSVAFKVKTTENTQLVRVYSTNAPNGSWAMRYSDIDGLTPVQIQNKFALQNTPTHICDVNIPAGTTIYVGVVNPNFGYTGLGIQFDLDWQNQEAWFSNFRPLS